MKLSSHLQDISTRLGKVITFTMGCKVTQPFAPSACPLNKCTVKLEEIFVRGPCCGCYENSDCACQLAFGCKWQFWCINSPPASAVIWVVGRIHKGGTWGGEGLDKSRAHSGKRFDLVSSLMDVLLRAERRKRRGQENGQWKVEMWLLEVFTSTIILKHQLTTLISL